MIEIWGRRTLWAGDTEVIVEDREAIKTGILPDFRRLLLGTACCVRVSQKHPPVSTGDCLAPHIERLLGTVRNLGDPGGGTQSDGISPASCESLDAAVAVASARLGFDYWQQHSTLIPECARSEPFSLSD